MTGRQRSAALVLKTRAFGDDALIVDLLCEALGRVSVVARGARKSLKRYGGALEMGARIDAEVRFAPGRDLHTLGACEVTTPLRKIREDLDRIHSLAYLLELVRLSTREGAGDAALFTLACGMVDTLEQVSPTPELLALWDLALFGRLGYGPPPLSSLPDAARRTLERLSTGDAEARFSEADVQVVRRYFDHQWTRVLGQAPRSARFLAA